MPRTNVAQLNVRSQYARDRVDALTRQTGMTATEVVEEALRCYHPQVAADDTPPGFTRKGWLLIPDMEGPIITLEEANAALDEEREGSR